MILLLPPGDIMAELENQLEQRLYCNFFLWDARRMESSRGPHRAWSSLESDNCRAESWMDRDVAFSKVELKHLQLGRFPCTLCVLNLIFIYC